MKTSVHCVLLCAGQSVRMRPAHKLFLPLHNATVIKHVFEQVMGANFTSVTVVTGHDSEKTHAEIKNFPFKSVHNPDFKSGMHSSIRSGLSHLKNGDGFVAICLGDQPSLKSSNYLSLIDAAQKNPEALLICPEFKGQRGNPVLINLKLREVILSHPDSDRGCSYLFADYPGDIISVSMEDNSSLLDLDTPEDYQCLLTSTNL